MSIPPQPQPAQPQHPNPGPSRPRTGTIAWGLGFLAYIPVPMVNFLVTGITQLIVGLRQREYGGVAAVNGVRAANWGLTQLCYPVLVAIVVITGVATGTPSETGGYTFRPWADALMYAMFALWVILGVTQLIYAIAGSSVASTGGRVRLPVIPFIRLPQPDPATGQEEQPSATMG